MSFLKTPTFNNNWDHGEGIDALVRAEDKKRGKTFRTVEYIVLGLIEVAEKGIPGPEPVEYNSAEEATDYLYGSLFNLEENDPERAEYLARVAADPRAKKAWKAIIKTWNLPKSSKIEFRSL